LCSRSKVSSNSPTARRNVFASCSMGTTSSVAPLKIPASVALVAGRGAVAWPLTAQAQQAGVPVIGFLSGMSPGTSANLVAAFRQGLGENGYIEGQNVRTSHSAGRRVNTIGCQHWRPNWSELRWQ
jgi:hypothetical protein